MAPPAASMGSGEGPSRTPGGVEDSGQPLRAVHLGVEGGCSQTTLPSQGASIRWRQTQMPRGGCRPGDPSGTGQVPASALSMASSKPQQCSLMCLGWWCHLVAPGHCASRSTAKIPVLGAGGLFC